MNPTILNKTRSNQRSDLVFMCFANAKKATSFVFVTVSGYALFTANTSSDSITGAATNNSGALDINACAIFPPR